MTLSASYALLANQVQWQHSKISQGAIDQTRLSIAGAPTEAAPFSFMVMGDTDAGACNQAETSAFSMAFAKQLIGQVKDSSFLIHTGDVTYPVGSYQNYLEGFLKPYEPLLSKLPESPSYNGDAVVFNRPLLAVPGNHDYTKSGYGLWQRSLRFVCDCLRRIGIDLGHYGGQGGEAYGQTFLDSLKNLSPQQLTAHLATHYTALITKPDSSIKPFGIKSSVSKSSETEDSLLQYGLSYRPGQFTRLPNRYYRFRYGGVDFFALDSNTWNTNPDAKDFDQSQLDWLESSLIESWQTPGTVGRIVYLHHSPYTTEAIRWQQPETLWVRRHLRSTFNRVAEALNPAVVTNSIVDVVISGHAHCLEHMRTTDTGSADAHTDWVICGGSGAEPRRQREAGADILESISADGKSRALVVAKSSLYVGTHGQRQKKQQHHSFLRIEVQPNQRQSLRICPYIVSRTLQGWQTQALEPINVGRTNPVSSPAYTHLKAS